MEQNSDTQTNISQWFVLNYLPTLPLRRVDAAQDCVRTFNERQKTALRIFIPTFITYVEGKEGLKKVDKPLAFHYAFVRGEFSVIKAFCAEPNGFSFVLNRCAGDRYAIVRDDDMESFKKIALGYANKVPYYSLEGVNLEDFDRVEVIDGVFKGLVGHYCPSPGGKKGRIVLKLTQSMGTVAYDIAPHYVRVLDFSPNFRRAYDIIDGFVPRLYKTMRKFYVGTPLEEKEISDLTSFCRRMAVCRLENHKIEARLMTILAMANRIIDDKEAEAEALERLGKRIKAVTAPSAKAFSLLLRAVKDNDTSAYQDGLTILSSIEGKSSKSLEELRSEYQHYSQFLKEND